MCIMASASARTSIAESALCGTEAAGAAGVKHSMVDVDLMAYLLVQHPQEFDVIAAPNLCGDVLADLGAVLTGSRAARNWIGLVGAIVSDLMLQGFGIGAFLVPVFLGALGSR